MNIREYSSFCGPAAVSAIVGCPRNDAATSLMRWSKRAGYPPKVSTAPTVMAAVLLMRGYKIERWGTVRGKWRTEPADVFAKRVWGGIAHDRENHDALVDAVERLAALNSERHPLRAVQRELDACAALRQERWTLRKPEFMTVREWLSRRRVGTWLLFVAQHVLVARGGKIISGDTAEAAEYGADELRDAWRVLRTVFQ